MVPAPPLPLPLRVCQKHGLVAGRDGRCVICRRNDDDRVQADGRRRWIAGLFAAAALCGGAAIWRGTHGRVASAAPAPSALPAPAPIPEAEGPLPPPADEIKAAAHVAAEQERQRDVEAEMLRVPVRMFTIKKCEMCDVARDWLRQRGMRLTEIPLDDDPAALEAMHRLTPSTEVPVFDVEGEVLVGFGPTNVAAAVRRAADKRTRWAR